MARAGRSSNSVIAECIHVAGILFAGKALKLEYGSTPGALRSLFRRDKSRGTACDNVVFKSCRASYWPSLTGAHVPAAFHKTKQTLTLCRLHGHSTVFRNSTEFHFSCPSMSGDKVSLL